MLTKLTAQMTEAEKTIAQNTNNAFLQSTINDKFKAIKDYVIERGTNDGWNYCKWNSGNIECWKSVTDVINFDNDRGNGHVTQGVNDITTAIPSGLLTSVDDVQLTSSFDASNMFIFTNLRYVAITSIRYRYWSNTIANDVSIKLFIKIIGSWK